MLQVSKSRPVRTRLLLLLIALVVGGAATASAQSQAINATIEGTITDASSAVLPGVTVTVTNVETNATRSFVTNERGEYRAPLLPLGSYRVRVELTGFKTVERSGISLSAGQTAVVNAVLEVGALEETVQVVAETPIADPAKIDLGRTIGAVEVQNLPNVARNTFNFALLQPNVTGYANEEFGATRINANGTQMRTNYQIDGASATQKDRAGLRMFQPSDIMVQEVKVTTSGFAPEFGQTTGMVYNAITPSGTNSLRGQGSYRFRRKSFSEKPFTLTPGAPKPDTKVDNFAAALGGPIRRDKAFFYVGYEWLENDLSANRTISVTPQTASILGLSPEALGEGVIPAVQTVNMFIAKADVELNTANRLSARWSVFNNTTPENIAGGLNTREVATDFQDRMDSVGVQLVSTIGNDKLNEFRFAYGKRNNPREPSAVAGTGPEIRISGVANFGGAPTATEFVQEYWQLIDNFSWLVGRHNLKAGFDVQFIDDFRQNDIHPVYQFATTDAYLAAKNGTNPFSYTRFTQSIGDPTVSYSQTYWSFFLQDDFRIASRLKLLYGIRYDLFKVPDADPNAPYPPSRDFRIDKNNWAPRVGIAWTLDEEARSVVRASTGLMYEPPLGQYYQDALQESGAPQLLSANLAPTQPGAPPFPGTLDNLPPGVTPLRSIRAVASHFDTQYTWLSNVQYERAMTEDISIGLGYVNSTGRSLATVLNSNVVPTGAILPDGRPIYSRTISAATRVDPNFDVIREIRSSGESAYNAFTVSMNRRFRKGFQAQASYTWAKAKDDGIIGGRYVVGSTDAEALSDPSDQERDYSYTSWDTRHNFAASAVVAPVFEGDGIGTAILNNNQLSLIMLWNSGLPYNIVSNQDLNLDGISADRPNDIARNSGVLGTVFYIDARYSRFIPFGGNRKAEIFIEAQNVFNNNNTRSVNSVVQTDKLGNPLAPIPDEFPATNAYQARQMQIGFKVLF